MGYGVHKHRKRDKFVRSEKKEREVIEELQAILNMVRAFRSKEEANEVGREFREIHKEEKKEYDKVYREANEKKKRDNDKIYRENNRDKLLAKIECACGNTYFHKNKSRHEKCKKHQECLKTFLTSW